MSELLVMLSSPLVQRALIVGCVIAAVAALLGVLLVLDHHALIGHGLSDVGFASASLAVALGWSPFAVSIPIVMGASVLIHRMGRKRGNHGDAAVGMVATTALATGVIITKLTNGFNMDVYNYMFGSLLALQRSDVFISVLLGAVVVLLFTFFYNRLFLLSYDANHAAACGLKVEGYRLLIALLTGIAIVVGMRLMGALLISSLLIFPPVTARRLANSFKSMVVLSGLISLVCVTLGIFASFMLDLPTGASIAVANALVFGIVSVATKGR